MEMEYILVSRKKIHIFLFQCLNVVAHIYFYNLVIIVQNF
jgi:hypothetical protein